MAVGRCSRRRCCCYSFVFFFPLPSVIYVPPPRLFCSSPFMVWRWQYRLRQRGMMEVALRWRINPGGDPSSSPLCLSAFLFFSFSFFFFSVVVSLFLLSFVVFYSPNDLPPCFSQVTPAFLSKFLLFYIRKLFSLRLRARSFFFKTKILPPLIFYFLSPFAPLCYVFPTLCLSLFFFPFSSKIPPVIFFSGRSLFSLLYYFPFFFLFFSSLCCRSFFFLLSSSPPHFTSSLFLYL